MPVPELHSHNGEWDSAILLLQKKSFCRAIQHTDASRNRLVVGCTVQSPGTQLVPCCCDTHHFLLGSSGPSSTAAQHTHHACC